MSKENFVCIGKLGKTFGVNGEIRCHIDPRFHKDFFKTSVVFLKIGGNKTPFFIQNIYEGEGLSLTLEDVNSKEVAMKLNGGEVWMREKDLHTIPVEKVKNLTQYERLQGFEVRGVKEGPIAVIQDFMLLPQQVLLVIEVEGREVYIPYQEALIQEVDLKEKFILMDLPEGLLDL